MATFSKPTIVPNWATTTGNIAVPSAGRRNDGWLTNEKPPSDIENWNKRTTGEWLEWIDERLDDGLGVASTGDITAIVAADLVVGVDTDTFVLDDGTNPAVTFTFDDDGSHSETSTDRSIDHTGTESALAMRDLIVTVVNAAPTLDITASPGVAIEIVSLVNDAIGTAGNVTITETVGDAGFLVSGMSGGLELNDVLEVIVGAFSLPGVLDLTGKDILLRLSVNLDVDKNIVVSGTGGYKHGEFKQSFHSSSIIQTSDISFSLTNYDVIIGATTTKAVMPITLPTGKRITRVRFKAFGGDGNSKAFSLQYTTAANSTPTVVQTQNNSFSGAATFQMSIPGFHVILPDRMYFLQMISSSGSTTDRWTGAEVVFDEP